MSLSELEICLYELEKLEKVKPHPPTDEVKLIILEKRVKWLTKLIKILATPSPGDRIRKERSKLKSK